MLVSSLNLSSLREWEGNELITLTRLLFGALFLCWAVVFLTRLEVWVLWRGYFSCFVRVFWGEISRCDYLPQKFPISLAHRLRYCFPIRREVFSNGYFSLYFCCAFGVLFFS